MKDINERGLENQVKGTAKEMKGKIRGDLGDATDNTSQHIKGRAEQLEGKVQKNFGKGERNADPDNKRYPIARSSNKKAPVHCTGAFFVVKTLALECRRPRGTRSCISSTALGELPAGGRPHLVEFDLLVRVEQPLDLRMSTVANHACLDRNAVQLGLHGFVKRHDLPVLLLDERIDRRLLLWRELQLVCHALAVRLRPAHLATVVGPNYAFGGEAKSSAGEKCAEEKHQRVAFCSIHRNPQCDMT